MNSMTDGQYSDTRFKKTKPMSYQDQFRWCIKNTVATVRSDSYYECGKLAGICGSKHCQKAHAAMPNNAISESHENEPQKKL
jgi:hypothetical protein